MAKNIKNFLDSLGQIGCKKLEDIFDSYNTAVIALNRLSDSLESASDIKCISYSKLYNERKIALFAIKTLESSMLSNCQEILDGCKLR
jgi:hypothetical protein